MTLREAVETKHRLAEQTELAQAMIKGTLTEELYHQFVFNMSEVYAAIERKIPYMPEAVARSKQYAADLAALNRGAGTVLYSTSKYIQYLSQLDVPRTWAHVYVHYLGNMYGGQMLKKNLPWKASHLEFSDVKSCISYVRANIADIDPAEANRSFDWTIQIYDELYRTFGQNSAASKNKD